MTTTVTPPTLAEAPATDPGDGPRARRVVFPLGWLRGIAALAVVTFHAYQHNRSGADSAWPWSGAAHQAMLGTDLFVDMFFVLSGLVLWLPVVRSAIDGERGRPGRVLLYRRMARLVPLYATVVLVVWAVTNPVFPGHWQDLLLHLTFTHVYSDTYIFWTDGPAWSLAVEFHFYLLMALAVPVVNAAARRTPSRAGRIAVVSALPVASAVVGVAYLLWATVLTSQSPENWSIWFSPLSRAADFGLGMGLAVLSAAGLRLSGRVRGTAAVAGTAALAALVMTRPISTTGEWWHPLYAAGDHGRPGRGRAARRPVARLARLEAAGLGRDPRVRRLPDPRAGDAVHGLARAAARHPTGRLVPGERRPGRRAHHGRGLGQLPHRRGRRPPAAVDDRPRRQAA